MRTLVALLLFLLSSTAVGDNDSGLTSGAQYQKSSAMEKLAYVSAVIDSVNTFIREDTMIDSLDKCIGEMTLGQMTEIVDKYIDEMPQISHRRASTLVIAAFIAEEDCKELMPLLPPVG